MASTLGPDLLAAPPLDGVFNNAAGNVAAMVYGAMLAVFLAWGLARRQTRWLVPAIVLGGLLTSCIEPLLDVLTGCFYPNIDQRSAVFAFMGRRIPLGIVECYALYYGVFGALNFLAIRNGLSRRGVWLWFLLPLLGDMVLEQVMLQFGMYSYYGNQPLVLHRFPLYQPAGNSVGELLAVATLFLLGPRLVGARWLVACVVMPLAGVMGFVGVCWPSFYAVHSDWPAAAVQACGVLTWALAALMVHGISLLIARDSPLRASGRLVLP